MDNGRELLQALAALEELRDEFEAQRATLVFDVGGTEATVLVDRDGPSRVVVEGGEIPLDHDG